MFIDINIKDFLAFAISFKYVFRKTLLKPYVQGFSIRNVYCTKISKEIDSKCETKMTSVQSILRGMKYIISISESISEMQHGTLIDRYMRSVQQRARKNLCCRYEEILRPIALLNRSLMR